MTALRDVSVEIPTGDQVAVVGPSGSGKTTMLTILGHARAADLRAMCESPATTPSRASDGELAGLRAHQIGFVFQAFHLQESMTAVDNVATGMLYTGSRARPSAASWPARRWSASGSATGSSSSPSSCPAVSASASRSRARSPSARRSSSPTSRPATSTRSRAPGCSSVLHELGSDGATLVLITHDENIAGGFPRRLHMRDGEIVEDERG